MRRIILVMLGTCILSTFNFGCVIDEIQRQQRIKEIDREWEARIANWEVIGRQLVSIKESAINRGYLTVDELKVALTAMSRGPVTYSGHWTLNPASREAYYLLTAAIIRDLLPFKPLFYLSLEKENYDEAELVRRNWSDCLGYLKGIFQSLAAEEARYGETVGKRHISGLRYYEISLKDCTPALRKLQLEYEKLQIVGLTDPIQIGLRKELTNAIKEKKWDDAQKIQNLIASRVKEFSPQTPATQRITDKSTETSSGPQTTAVVQQPSELNLKVEQIPRYGATDIGRAINILDGKGEKLSPKAEGTLRLLDILLKR